MTASARSSRLPGIRPRARRAMAATAFGCMLLFAPVAAYADFGDGVRAYQAGDHKAAYEAWLPLAEGGDVAAMRNIGHLYRWGQGVGKDINQAIHWYRMAAEKGFSRAQANLAAIYLQGDEGVPVNYEEAHKWFAAAAIQNLAVAQYNLGLMYELGLGVEKSDARALGWYNLAAKAGQPEAIERLSQLVKTTEPPLVSGVKVPGDAPASTPAPVPQAASTDTKAETTSASPVSPAPAPSVPEPTTPAASMPAKEPEPPKAEVQPVPAPESEPAKVAAPQPAPVPSAAETESPAEQHPAEDNRPGLLGRFYSAISSGGGVSIPDMFKSSEQAEAEQPAAPEKPGQPKPPAED